MSVQIMSLIITSEVMYFLEFLKMMVVFRVLFSNVITLANTFCTLRYAMC